MTEQEEDVLIDHLVKLGAYLVVDDDNNVLLVVIGQEWDEEPNQSGGYSDALKDSIADGVTTAGVHMREFIREKLGQPT